MKTISKPTLALSILATATFSGNAYAECSTNMAYVTLVECITVEGAGVNYKDWKENYDNAGTPNEKELDGDDSG